MNTILFWFAAFEMKIYPKIVTSLADIFTMEKALLKITFWHKIFICQPIFKIFVALFKTFGKQNDDMVIIFLNSFRKVRF